MSDLMWILLSRVQQCKHKVTARAYKICYSRRCEDVHVKDSRVHFPVWALQNVKSIDVFLTECNGKTRRV